jgi:hypothetical protein
VLESVNQPFVPDEKLSSKMELFRQILNDCIRLGLAENKTSFMSLRYLVYPKLTKYKIESTYKNNAAINIRKRGLEKLFSLQFSPIGLTSKTVKGNPEKEFKREAVLRVDGSQSVPVLNTQNGVPST